MEKYHLHDKKVKKKTQKGVKQKKGPKTSNGFAGQCFQKMEKKKLHA